MILKKHHTSRVARNKELEEQLASSKNKIQQLKKRKHKEIESNEKATVTGKIVPS
jgi:hypothetical protein